MNEEIIEIDPLTDTDKFKRQLSEQQQEILRELRETKKLLIDRDQLNRSFWRAVFNALWSMVSHGHAQLKKLFEE